jgi:hypothetical protein
VATPGPAAAAAATVFARSPPPLTPLPRRLGMGAGISLDVRALLRREGCSSGKSASGPPPVDSDIPNLVNVPDSELLNFPFEGEIQKFTKHRNMVNGLFFCWKLSNLVKVNRSSSFLILSSWRAFVFTHCSRAQADSNSDSAARPVELLQGPVLPRVVTQQTTMLSPYGILRGPTRHFFSDGMATI